MKTFNARFWVIASMIFAGAALRLVPHWPNVTPIAAMALFGGAFFGRRYLAFIVPLIAMLVSDLIIGLHNTMPAVYVSFAATVLIGMFMLRKPSVLKVTGAAFLSSVIFFTVTNFASWLGSPLYPQNLTGLMESYMAGLMFFNDGSYGISFFLNSLLGDLFYTAAFFGVFALAKLRFPALAKA